ncbi:MAG: hypothetical protein VCA73_09565 [Roseibacillus sp.]|jgi:hypothetical protein
MKRTATIILLACLASLLSVSAAEFEVAGMKFSAPKEFTAVKPKSAMRKAQFAVDQLAMKGEIVFFYFGPGGAGGVEANVKRWLGQFDEPKEKLNAKTEKTKAGDVAVTFVSAQGTFLTGPPGDVPILIPGWALLGAIIESKQGAIFAKFTGPRATVEANSKAFRKMITAAKPTKP